MCCVKWAVQVTFSDGSGCDGLTDGKGDEYNSQTVHLPQLSGRPGGGKARETTRQELAAVRCGEARKDPPGLSRRSDAGPSVARSEARRRPACADAKRGRTSPVRLPAGRCRRGC